MLHTSTNLHRVVGITTQTRIFADFVSTIFRFAMSDGGVVEVDAFSAEPLEVTQLPLHTIAAVVAEQTE